MDEELNEYFKERAQAEEYYGKLLAKISKRLQMERDKDKDRHILGAFGKIWTKLSSTNGDFSRCQLLLSEKLVKDFENALKNKEKNDSALWTESKKLETALAKLAKENDDKKQKLDKRQQEANKTPEKQAESKEKKLREAKGQYDEIFKIWQKEAGAVFEKYENLDRKQCEFIKNTMQKSLDVQIDNLRLQLMNLEEISKQLTETSVNDEIQLFVVNYAKEIDEESSAPISAASNSNSEIAENAQNDAPAANLPSEKFEVDADGFRIPQMDHDKWKNEISASTQANADDDDDEQQKPDTAKFKIDIKAEASEVKAEDLENAAAMFKDVLTMKPNSSASVRRGARKGHSASNSMMSNSAFASNVSTPMQMESPLPSRMKEMRPISEASSSPDKNSLLESSDFFGSIGSSIASPALVPSLIASPSPNGNSMKNSDIMEFSSRSSGALDQEATIESIKHSGIAIKMQEILNSETNQLSGSLYISVKNEITTSKISTSVSVKLTWDGQFTPETGIQISPKAGKVRLITIPIATLNQKSDILLGKYQRSAESQPPVKLEAKVKTSPAQTQLAIIYETTDPSFEIKDFSVLACASDDATAAITKPTAAWNEEKKKILWKIVNVTEGGKMLAQWSVKNPTTILSPVAFKYVAEDAKCYVIDAEIQISGVKAMQCAVRQALAVSAQTSPIFMS